MPKVRASSGTIGTTRLPNFSSRIRSRSIAVNTIVVDTAAARALGQLVEDGRVGQLERRRSAYLRLGTEPPQRAAAHHVLDSGESVAGGM
jgi:hypothetical protein